MRSAWRDGTRSKLAGSNLALGLRGKEVTRDRLQLIAVAEGGQFLDSRGRAKEHPVPTECRLVICAGHSERLHDTTVIWAGMGGGASGVKHGEA